MQVTSGAGPPAPASLEAAALTLLEVAWALEYLHHMHIVHRDLKPTNVLLASSPVCTPGRRQCSLAPLHILSGPCDPLALMMAQAHAPRC